jgi:hypothetical protein
VGGQILADRRSKVTKTATCIFGLELLPRDPELTAVVRLIRKASGGGLAVNPSG